MAACGVLDHSYIYMGRNMVVAGIAGVVRSRVDQHGDVATHIHFVRLSNGLLGCTTVVDEREIASVPNVDSCLGLRRFVY